MVPKKQASLANMPKTAIVYLIVLGAVACWLIDTVYQSVLHG